MAIPYVTYNPATSIIYLYDSPEQSSPASFQMDSEQCRELIVLLVTSIVHIERKTDRIKLLFDELLQRLE